MDYLRLHPTVTAFSQPDAIKAAQSDIDSEIQRLNSCICLLNSRRNLLCRISRLPPELLSEVFLLLAEQLQAQDRFKVDFKWINVAHVCRLWRNIALQHGRLWGKIDTTRLERAAAFVDRSKGAPLAIRESFTGPLAELPVPFKNPSYRYRELHLRAEKGELGSAVRHILNSPTHAPVLESLALVVSSDYPEYTLPSTIFDYRAPALTRLQLQNVRLEWPTSLFPSLTHLSIYHKGNDSSPRPPVSRVLTTLKNMPRLEHLDLCDQTIFDQPLPLNNVSVEDLPSVSLPHLVALRLFGTTYDCITLVSHITLSSSVELEIHCTGVETVPEIRTLMDFVRDNFARSSVIDSSSLGVHMDARQSELSLKVEMISGMKPKSLVSLRMYPRVMEFFEGRVSTVCPIIFDSIPAAATKRLDIRSRFSISADAWTYVLNRMTQVSVLDASFAGAIDLSHVLGSSTTNAPSFVAKQLESLKFSGVSFTCKTSQQLPFHEALLGCLQKRSDGDQRIKNLNFYSCSDLDAKAPSQFRKVAQKVEWDEEEDTMMLLSDD